MSARVLMFKFLSKLSLTLCYISPNQASWNTNSFSTVKWFMYEENFIYYIGENTTIKPKH